MKDYTYNSLMMVPVYLNEPALLLYIHISLHYLDADTE